MSGVANHLIVAPILVPFVAAAAMLFIEERNRTAKAMISLGSSVLMLAIALLLLRTAGGMDSAAGNAGGAYLLGNWPAPFGIVLVLDRLSAMMLMLTATLAIPALAFSLARWHNAGAHFHTLFQLLLMGLNGAFLTGDIFNLFVFFEVMLAASYGLLLHGSGQQRVKAGMHYLVINLASALLFLIGVSLVYGTAGTLNMADLALRMPEIAADRRVFLEAGLAVLGVVFLIKAGVWPLNFWLPTAYSAAAAPVSGIFAILSKLGIYVLLRLTMLTSGDGPELSQVAHYVLLAGGLATVTFGAIGVLASQALGRLAGYSVLVSSGTLLAVLGLGGVSTSGALFYLISSTLTVAAFFLLIELIERGQDAGASVLAVSMEVYGDADEDESDDEIGVTMPGTMAVLAVCFSACAILLSGLPPLSGFVAKFAILTGVIGSGTADSAIGGFAWLAAALIIFSGLSALIAMTRSGIRTFWASIEGTVPRVLVIEMAPVLILLTLTLALTIGAGPVMRYMEETAATLSQPRNYINAVFEARRAGQEEARP